MAAGGTRARGARSWARWARSSRSFPDLMRPNPRAPLWQELGRRLPSGCRPHLLRLCSNPDFPSTQSTWSEHFFQQAGPGAHRFPGPGRLQCPLCSSPLPSRSGSSLSSSAPEPPEVLHLPPEERIRWLLLPPSRPPCPHSIRTRSWGQGSRGPLYMVKKLFSTESKLGSTSSPGSRSLRCPYRGLYCLLWAGHSRIYTMA